MATATVDAPARPGYRFTRDQYHRMGEAGILPARGVELISGVILVPGQTRNGETARFRFDLDQYERMIDLGILGPEDRVELIHGEVLSKMAHNDPHATCVEHIHPLLLGLCPVGWVVRSQLPMVVGNNQPEPDFVLCLPAKARGGKHPRPEHVSVAMEVSDTSLRYDQTTKLELYTTAGIPVYWIVNLPDRRVEVYTDPETPADADPVYRTRTDYGPGASVPVAVAGTAVGLVPVEAILP